VHFFLILEKKKERMLMSEKCVETRDIFSTLVDFETLACLFSKATKTKHVCGILIFVKNWFSELEWPYSIFYRT